MKDTQDVVTAHNGVGDVGRAVRDTQPKKKVCFSGGEIKCLYVRGVLGDFEGKRDLFKYNIS